MKAHWSYNPELAEVRKHRREAELAFRKGISLEELEVRRELARITRRERKMNLALGRALAKLTMGKVEEWKPKRPRKAQGVDLKALFEA